MAELVERLVERLREYLREHFDARIALEVELRERIAELEALFDARWKADQRAIKRWQADGVGRGLIWPDHADLGAWLLDQADKTEALSEANERALIDRITELEAERDELAAALKYLMDECDPDMDDDYNPHSAPLAAAKKALEGKR